MESETKVVNTEKELDDIFSGNKNNYYEDKDLKTPQHDKIMDYIINDIILTKIINIIYNRQRNNDNKLETPLKWKIIEEFPIDKYHPKYIDLHAELISNNDYNNECDLILNIEVKTTIPSIGELIRQINSYRFICRGTYIVITPNVTESLKNRLSIAKIHLIDTKDLGMTI